MSEGEFSMPVAGEHHHRLRPFEGTFRAKVNLFMGPDSSVSTGTMVNRIELDGLYLAQSYQGDPMPAPYPAFVGRGYWGYNFHSKLYEGFWIDNASSVMQVETGSVDESGRVWTMHSQIELGGGTLKRRSVISLIDDDHHSMASFMTHPGSSEVKTMEIQYQRLS
jgi:hypothetical protein